MCAIALGMTASACGSEEDQRAIPQDQGNAVLEQLQTVQDQLDAGECDAAEATAQGIQDTIDSISQEVPPDLEEALVEASGNLSELTRSQCEVPEPEPEPVEPTGPSGEEGSLEEGSEEDDD